MRALGLIFVATLLTACGGSATGAKPTDAPAQATTCTGAFRDAAGVDQNADSVTDLYPAVRACGSLAEWKAGFAAVDGAGFQGTPESVLANLCNAGEVADEDLCVEVKPEAPGAAEPTEGPAAEEPQLTAEQENAIGSAQDYLDYTAFSRSGLIKQLIYEGYSKAVSTFAVDHIKVDWKEQAYLSAKAYLDYSHFSRKGLIAQLKYEGFTTKQATYGVNKAGL